jgi:hypothetical protein
MSDELDFEFVAAATRGFDKENPNHVRAARLLLNEIGMDGPHAIVTLSRILDMNSRDAFMFDTSAPDWYSRHAGLSKVTDDRTPDEIVDEAVRSLVGEVSERFVPQPSNESRTIDMINGMGEFKTRCRWAEYWRNRNFDRAKTEQVAWAAYYHEHPDELSASLWERSKTDPNWQWPDPTSKLTYEQEADYCDMMEQVAGLGTGLKRENPKSRAPVGSPELECFLKQLEEELLKQSVDEVKKNNQSEHATSAWVKDVLKDLKQSGRVVVPTDKTNSFRTMEVEKYKEEVNKHLSERAVPIERAKLTEIHDRCADMLEGLEGLISEKEAAFLDEKIKSKAIPQPKILIKDHKKPDEAGNFPTRLVV